MNYALRKTASSFLLHALLLIFGLIIIVPILWVIFTSFKSGREMFRIPASLLPKQPTLQNYADLSNSFPVLRLLVNSFLYAGLVTVSSYFFSTMIGYGFAKFRNKLSDLLFTVILTAIMVPFFIRLIPLYLLITRLGGSNTLWGLFLPNFLSVFGIFFMRQYCMTIPDELIQATRIDGASEPRILWSVMFPLMQTPGATLAAIKFIDTWNDFLWPLVMLTEQANMTITIAIASFIDPTTMTRYGPIMAGAVIMLVPVVILFLILQKHVVAGIVMSGFKS